MSRLRLLVGVLAVCVLAGGLLMGQDKTKGQLPPNWKKLGLSDEQKEKIYKIQGEFGEKIGALKKQLSQLQKEEKGQLMEVLTDANKARLRELATADLDKKPEKDKKTEKDKKDEKKPEVKDKGTDK